MSGGELAAALGLALLWDLSLGEPPAALSPRAWMAGLARLLGRRLPRGGRKRELAGAALLVLAVPLGFATLALGLLLWLLPAWPVPAFLATVVLLRGSLSLLEIGRASLEVLRALEVGTLEQARVLLSAWTGRAELGALHGPGRDGLVAATVGAIARRTSETAIAPLFWFAVLGLPGAVLYRGTLVLRDELAGPAPAPPGERGSAGSAAPAGEATGPGPGSAGDPAEDPAGDLAPAPAALAPPRPFAAPLARLHELLLYVPARLAVLLLVLAGALAGEDARRGMALAARAAGRLARRSAELPAAALVGLLGLPDDGPGEELLTDVAGAGPTVALLPPAAIRIHDAWRVACLATAAWAAPVALLLWSAGGPLLDPVRP